MNRLIAGIILVILLGWFIDTYACEDHAFFRIGAGKQGNWLAVKGDGNWIGEKAIAADISLGYRAPIKDWLWWDITGRHQSGWDYGWPANDKDEDELDSIILGLEVRVY